MPQPASLSKGSGQRAPPRVATGIAGRTSHFRLPTSCFLGTPPTHPHPTLCFPPVVLSHPPTPTFAFPAGVPPSVVMRHGGAYLCRAARWGIDMADTHSPVSRGAKPPRDTLALGGRISMRLRARARPCTLAALSETRWPCPVTPLNPLTPSSPHRLIHLPTRRAGPGKRVHSTLATWQDEETR